MLAQNDTHINGVNGHVNGYAHVLECPSDYEERPAIDITPSQSQSKWRDQYPLYTHNLSWQDGDGCKHSLTLRSDSITDLLSDLKMVKAGICQAKKEYDEDSPTQPETQQERVLCKIHGVEMERRVSKRTGGHYHSHKLANRELCFGREKK